MEDATRVSKDLRLKNSSWDRVVGSPAPTHLTPNRPHYRTEGEKPTVTAAVEQAITIVPDTVQYACLGIRDAVIILVVTLAPVGPWSMMLFSLGVGSTARHPQGPCQRAIN